MTQKNSIILAMHHFYYKLLYNSFIVTAVTWISNQYWIFHPKAIMCFKTQWHLEFKSYKILVILIIYCYVIPSLCVIDEVTYFKLHILFCRLDSRMISVILTTWFYLFITYFAIVRVSFHGYINIPFSSFWSNGFWSFSWSCSSWKLISLLQNILFIDVNF